MLTFLIRMFAGCSHDSTYRERRLLHDAEVMHFVCHDCGHAVPAVDRTAEEHRMMLQQGAVRFPQAHPQGAFAVKRGFRRSA